MTVEQALIKFADLQQTLHAYTHAQRLISYDSVTIAPSDTAYGRGKTLGALSSASYDLMISPETEALVNFLSDHADALTFHQKRQVEEFRHNVAVTKCVPQEEYVAYKVLINQAKSTWHKAKAENDFASFAPLLEKLFAYNIKFAHYCDPTKKPYDVLLDQFERGLTQEKADAFFGKLRERIVPLLKRIQQAPQIDDSFLNKPFPIEKQKELSEFLMDIMTIDRSHCVIGTTEHPFTVTFNKFDARVTTHYYLNRFSNSMFSVVHECGHALYEMNIADENSFTSLAGGVSKGIHESQSRLYENLIGRSRPFIHLVYPKLCELSPEQFAGVSEEQVYRALNKVEPSYIRIVADELTYPLHIMVRYEIEKQLIGGQITVQDLPRVWGEMMKEYLGVDVPTDTLGVLQDSHWGNGNIGYFPTYALGSAYGAQIIAKMREELDVDAVIATGSLGPIIRWLAEHLYQYGKLYDPEDLFARCCGKPFDPEYYIQYLEKKYTELYQL